MGVLNGEKKELVLKWCFKDTAQNRDTLKVGLEMLIQKGLYWLDTEHSHQWNTEILVSPKYHGLAKMKFLDWVPQDHEKVDNTLF